MINQLGAGGEISVTDIMWYKNNFEQLWNESMFITYKKKIRGNGAGRNNIFKENDKEKNI